MWRFFEKNFMLDLTCSLAHVHTIDVCVYPFLGQYVVSQYKKDGVYGQSWYVIRQPFIYIYIYIYIYCLKLGSRLSSQTCYSYTYS